MTLEFTKEELAEIQKEMYDERIEDALDKMIRYLRHLETEEEGKGKAELLKLWKDKVIPSHVYESIKPFIDDPELKYEIKIV